MPTLAWDLCWRQFDLFAAGGPYNQATAKLALQPLINLGRLHTRDGSGSAAYQLHEALLEAAKTRTHACIDGRPVAFERIVRSGDDHREIVRWLWTILLADGLRALCRAGRWGEAHQQAKQHNGIGQQLLDGRQVAVIAAATADQHTSAMHLIDATTTPTTWEQALAACLRVLCLTRAQLPAADPVIAAMLDTYLSLDPTEHALFQVRLGLTITDLAFNHDTTTVVRRIESCALSTADAYAAHEILSNPTPLPLPDSARHTLDQTVQLASLGTPMPAPSLDNLQLSILDGEAALTRCLG